MIIQEVLANEEKNFPKNKEEIKEYNKCPWELRYVRVDKKDIWIKGQGSAIASHVCISGGGCNGCKTADSSKFFKLSRKLKKLNNC